MQDETYIRVRVTSRARKELYDVKNGVYHISVREKAEQGVANTRVRTVLARALGCREQQLRLVKGATAPSKLYLLIK